MFEAYVKAIKSSSHSSMHKWSRARIEKWLIDEMDKKEDCFLTAQETVDLGFADEIFTTWKQVVEFTPEQLARKK
jgi:ATP-dependent protease ClpP protease subunit